VIEGGGGRGGKENLLRWNLDLRKVVREKKGEFSTYRKFHRFKGGGRSVQYSR